MLPVSDREASGAVVEAATGASRTDEDDNGGESPDTAEPFPEQDWILALDRSNPATGWDKIPSDVFKVSHCQTK